jgi:hypothetical protein
MHWPQITYITLDNHLVRTHQSAATGKNIMKPFLMILFLLQGCAMDHPPLTNAQITEATKQCNDMHLKAVAWYDRPFSINDPPQIVSIQCAPPE